MEEEWKEILDPQSYKVLREKGKKPNFGFTPKDYLEIAENLLQLIAARIVLLMRGLKEL